MKAHIVKVVMRDKPKLNQVTCTCGYIRYFEDAYITTRASEKHGRTHSLVNFEYYGASAEPTGKAASFRPSGNRISRQRSKSIY